MSDVYALSWRKVKDLYGGSFFVPGWKGLKKRYRHENWRWRWDLHRETLLREMYDYVR